MTDVIRVMQREEAQIRVARVRAHVEQAWDDLIALHAERAWLSLGYESWDALCDAEFDGARIALPREDRREVVGQMREAGMSIPAIASATGASVGTIHNDLSELKGSGRDLPSEVTGLDGKTRPAKVTTTTRQTEATKVEQVVDTETGEVLDHTPEAAPSKPSAAKRKPLPEQFSTAAHDLAKAAERIARLASDDRFPQNAEKVAAKYRSDLIRAIDALQGVLNRLPSA